MEKIIFFLNGYEITAGYLWLIIISILLILVIPLAAYLLSRAKCPKCGSVQISLRFGLSNVCNNCGW
ncbi:MAG TPA: hypothetical protein DDY52_03080 [Candidatus Moranbacteria bacterium]|nr:hypothetical protein [Candidatus Moranbacteria bacterium]